MDARNDVQESITETTYPGIVHPSFSITRQKILNLTSVYERIPQTYMVGGEIDQYQPLPLMIVDETALPPMLATPRKMPPPLRLHPKEFRSLLKLRTP